MLGVSCTMPHVLVLGCLLLLSLLFSLKIENQTHRLHHQASAAGTLQVDSMSGKGGAGGGMYGDRKTIAQITTEGLGMGAMPANFLVRGAITFIRHEEGKQPFYQACPNETTNADGRQGKCGKKVQPMDGRYRCEKCNMDRDRCVHSLLRRFQRRLKLAVAIELAYSFCFFNKIRVRFYMQIRGALHSQLCGRRLDRFAVHVGL